jgi:hypothetical protein
VVDSKANDTRSPFFRDKTIAMGHGLCSAKMRRSVGSGIVMLLALIVAVAVIASTQQADETTELLKLLPNGLPDISGIQTQPPTKAQIRAQMKKDGLSIDLFKKVPACLFICLSFVRATAFLLAA